MNLTRPEDFAFYTPEMFGRTETSFLGLILSVIEEQGQLLSIRLGAAAYQTGGTLATKVEKNLVEAELLRLRIIRLVGTVINGDQADLRPLESQRQTLLRESDSLIAKISSGVEADSSGFSSGALVTGTGHGFPERGR
jgi:hypothetical protein